MIAFRNETIEGWTVSGRIRTSSCHIRTLTRRDVPVYWTPRNLCESDWEDTEYLGGVL